MKDGEKMDTALAALAKILTAENIALFISMMFNCFLGFILLIRDKQIVTTLDTLHKNNIALESVAKLVDQVTDQLQVLLIRK